MLSSSYRFFLIVCLPLIDGLKTTVTVSNRSSETYFLKQSQLMQNGLSYIFYSYTDSSDLRSINVSSTCISSLQYIKEALVTKQEWPLILFDASGRFPLNSIGTGYSDFGHFDNCLNVQWFNNGTQSTEVGQYCMSSLLPTLIESEWKENIFTRRKTIRPDWEAVFKIGFCIPSGCSQSDFESILVKVLEPYEWHFIKADRCSIKTGFIKHLSWSDLCQKIALAGLICIALLNFYATWVDWSSIKSTSKTHWSRHFSLIKGYNDLITPRSDPKDTFLIKMGTVLNFGALIYHTFLWWFIFKGYALFGDFGMMSILGKKWIRAALGDYSLELLFIYGTLIRSMNLWKATDPSLTQSYKSMVKKMIHLVLVQLAILLLIMVIPLFVMGPLSYQYADWQATSCKNSFWYNIFFWQNNYRPIVDMCLLHTWTVAVEFQILPVNIALIHLYKRKPGLAFTLNTLIVSSGFIYTGISAYRNDLVPFISFNAFESKVLERWFSMTYFPTSMHIWSYTMGPLWTYLIMNNFNQSNSILMRLAGSRKLLIITLACLHIIAGLHVQFEPIGPFWNGIYFILYRLFALLFYNFIVMMGADQMRHSFASPNDRKVTNAEIRNKDSNIGKDVLLCAESTGDQQLSHRKLHFVSSLLKSSFYIHVLVYSIYHSHQRWPMRSILSFIYTESEIFIWILIGGFIFHLFVVNPLDSLYATFKSKPKTKCEKSS